MDAERRRVLLAEDHEVVGQGIKALLTPYFEVLGPIRNGSEVMAAIEEQHPEAVVLDISMPGRNGLDLLPEIVRRYPRIPVVMLTTGCEDAALARIREAGVKACLAKPLNPPQLLDAVSRLALA